MEKETDLGILWRQHTSAPYMQDNLCQHANYLCSHATNKHLFIMLKCNIIFSHVRVNTIHVDIIMLHVSIIMLHEICCK